MCSSLCVRPVRGYPVGAAGTKFPTPHKEGSTHIQAMGCSSSRYQTLSAQNPEPVNGDSTSAAPPSSKLTEEDLPMTPGDPIEAEFLEEDLPGRSEEVLE